MPAINVWVSPVDHEIADDGLDREQVRLEVEKRFASAGLPVIQQNDGKRVPEFPCLGVLLNVVRHQGDPSPAYIYSIEIFFLQKISMADPPGTDIMHMAWCREATGDIRSNSQGFDWSNLYREVDCLVNQFIQESMGL